MQYIFFTEEEALYLNESLTVRVINSNTIVDNIYDSILSLTDIDLSLNEKIQQINNAIGNAKFYKDDNNIEAAYNIIIDLVGLSNLEGIINIIGYKFKFGTYNDSSVNKSNGIIDLHMANKFCMEISQILNQDDVLTKYHSCLYNHLYDTIAEKAIEEHKNEVIKKKVSKLYSYDECNLIGKHPDAYYKNMVTGFGKYIRGGTAEIYKYIIENKKYPENTNWQPLTMLSNKKSDIVRFADCFEIELKDASVIFGVKVMGKERNKDAVTDFLRLLRTYTPQLYKLNAA